MLLFRIIEVIIWIRQTVFVSMVITRKKRNKRTETKFRRYRFIQKYAFNNAIIYYKIHRLVVSDIKAIKSFIVLDKNL